MTDPAMSPTEMAAAHEMAAATSAVEETLSAIGWTFHESRSYGPHGDWTVLAIRTDHLPAWGRAAIRLVAWLAQHVAVEPTGPKALRQHVRTGTSAVLQSTNSA
jgi:hypothetical protein